MCALLVVLSAGTGTARANYAGSSATLNPTGGSTWVLTVQIGTGYTATNVGGHLTTGSFLSVRPSSCALGSPATSYSCNLTLVGPVTQVFCFDTSPPDAADNSTGGKFFLDHTINGSPFSYNPNVGPPVSGCPLPPDSTAGTSDVLAAALKKCKQKHSAKARRKCRKRAHRLYG